MFDVSAEWSRRKTFMSIDKIHIGMYFAHISLGFLKKISEISFAMKFFYSTKTKN